MGAWIVYGNNYTKISVRGNINRRFGEVAYINRSILKDIYVPRDFKFIYPHMGYFISGVILDNVFDIDFNNFYVQALTKILEEPIPVYKKVVIPPEFARRADKVLSLKVENPLLKDTLIDLADYLTQELKKMQKERHEMKNRYVLVVTDRLKDLNIVKAKEVFINEYTYYKTKKAHKVEQWIKEALIDYSNFGEYFDLKSAINVAYYLYRKGLNVAIVSDYDFRKYSLLAAIGNFRHYNDRLWQLTMSFASSILAYTLAYMDKAGVEKYSVYVDSIQTNENILDFPIFKYYPAKLDKRGEPYIIVLPPLYAVGKNSTEFLIKVFRINKDEFFSSLLEKGYWKATEFNHLKGLRTLKLLTEKYQSLFAKYIYDDVVKLPEGYKKYNDLVLWNEERELAISDYKYQEKMIVEACDFS